MFHILADVRFALRFLRRAPGFAAVAVGTLALAIAANTTVFGWIDTVLLRPIPGVAKAYELAALEGVSPQGRRLQSHAHPTFRDFQGQMTQASGVAAAHPAFFTIGPVEQSRRTLGQVVSANMFAVLGVKPFLGRLFSPEEDRDDRGAFPIAVISHRLWRSYFNSDAGVAGKPIRLNGRQFTIIGVTPPEFFGTFGGLSLDVWVPLTQATQVGALNTWAANDRNARFLNLIMRLKEGVSIEQASAEAKAVAARIAAVYPDTHRGISAVAVPIGEASYGLQTSLREPLTILMGACVLVLLIACANVANLLMARSVAREREFAVRLALGARGYDLIRLVFVEVLMLAGAGAVVGILLSRWLGNSMAYVFPVLDASIESAAQPMLQTEVNIVILAFTVLISFSAATLSVIPAAMAACRLDLNSRLREAGRSGMAGRRSHRARFSLVAGEVALTTVALIAAAIAIRTFQKLAAVDTGFNSRNVFMAHFYLSTNGYSLQQERQFVRNLRLRLEGTPGIEQTAYADSAPLSFLGPNSERVQVEGSEIEQGGVVSVSRSVVSPGYFSLMGIPILAGRDFTERDDAKAPLVIIVNENFARRYFGNGTALGRKVRISGNLSTIVGVVKNTKYRSPAEGATPFFYGPFEQIFFSGQTDLFYVRYTNAASAHAAFRRECAALDPNPSLFETSSLAAYTQAGLFAERIAAGLLSVLGMLSLALAAIGLYSVMVYAVNERTQEIGVRMAMGALPRQVHAMVLRQSLGMTVTGLLAGLAASFALVRTLASTVSIYGNEPLVYGAAVLCVLAGSVTAAWLPAMRATRVDPLTALRSE